MEGKWCWCGQDLWKYALFHLDGMQMNFDCILTESVIVNHFDSENLDSGWSEADVMWIAFQNSTLAWKQIQRKMKVFFSTLWNVCLSSPCISQESLKEAMPVSHPSTIFFFQPISVYFHFCLMHNPDLPLTGTAWQRLRPLSHRQYSTLPFARRSQLSLCW